MTPLKAATTTVKVVKVARGFPWLRMIALMVLGAYLLWTYWIHPALDDLTPWEGIKPNPSMPNIPGTPWPLIPDPPWDGIIPGSCSSVPTPEVRQARGFDAMWHDLGSAIRSIAEGPPSATEMRAWFAGAGDDVARSVHLVRSGAAGEPMLLPLAPPAPPEVTQVNGNLNDVQIAALATQAGWPVEEIPNVVARVMAESTGNPQARDYADGTHWGLLQLGEAERARYIPGKDAFDPLTNLTGARLLWEERGWQPWRASDAAVAAAGLGAGPVAGCTASAGSATADGLDPVVLPAKAAVLAAFGPMEVGGWGTRPNATEHDDMLHGKKASRALDFMVEGQRGDQVAQYLIDHAAVLRVEYLIWDHRQWSPSRGWRPYKGRSPHTDHVHLTVLRGGEIPRLAG